MSLLESDDSSVHNSSAASSPKPITATSLVVLLLILLAIFSLLVALISLWQQANPLVNLVDQTVNESTNEVTTWKKFQNADEFQAYFLRSSRISQDFIGQERQFLSQNTSPAADITLDVGSTPNIDRVSTTNIQVEGVDEPDIVKTNGTDLFISGDYFSFGPIERLNFNPVITGELSPQRDLLYPDYQLPQTRHLKIYPPTDLNQGASIQASGELLLDDNTLIFTSATGIQAYSIREAQQPQQLWEYNFEDSFLVTARLKQSELYVVIQKYIYTGSACPIPLLRGTEAITVPCAQIYYPDGNFPADTTYTVLKLAVNNGKVLAENTFVGSSHASVVYMSENNIFITQTRFASELDYMNDFLTTTASDLFSQDFITQMALVKEMNISDQAKQTEYNVLFEKFYQTLSTDERKRTQNEFNNRLEKYLTDHGRDLEYTSIVKINSDTLELVGHGQVPGRPLNQFSLDEYQDYLRIATTIGGRQLGGISANDVYVLDTNMTIQGQVIDMGLDERIYAVRFIGNRGYVVTFKEIDPFYVLNLDNPNQPKITGELKIPGFSSYLHPLNNDQILGIGRQDSQVKLSIFDVNDPLNPTEVDTYLMDEYWTEVTQNHRAFLHDTKNEIFFLPANEVGYIFAYQPTLSLIKVVSDIQAQRAVFVNDYLYIIGKQGLVVFDQTSWEEINRIEFD